VAAFGDGTIRHLADDGTVSTYAQVDAPAGMDVTADGTVYVTSIRTRTVHRVDPASRVVTEVPLR
jgi:streptogramin lyase